MAAYMGHRNTFRKSFRKFASSSVSVPRNSPSTNSAAPARSRQSLIRVSSLSQAVARFFPSELSENNRCNLFRQKREIQ